MDEQVIICPKCKARIPLSEAVTHQIREELNKEFVIQNEEKEQELKKLVSKLEAKEKSIDKAIQEQLTKERQKLKDEIKKEAKENIELEMTDMQKQLDENKKKLKEANAKELELREKARKLEEAKENMELEMTRRLDSERDKIRDTLSKKIMEEHQMKDKEYEKRISDLNTKIDELKRKAELGSQQLQGEVQELELEEILKAHFPKDEIEPVPKGMRGADVLQHVNKNIGQYAGTIIWESKRTQNWSNDWIPKLKDDQIAAKADIAAIVTETMPDDIDGFGLKEDVWVTSFGNIVGVATALRATLIQVFGMKIASEGKKEKMGMLYDYLTGPQFKQKVECVIEVFATLNNDLEKEKRAITRLWAKREKEMERVILSMGGMYGDIQGIVGSSLLEIESLDLKMLTKKEDEEEQHGFDN